MNIHTIINQKAAQQGSVFHIHEGLVTSTKPDPNDFAMKYSLALRLNKVLATARAIVCPDCSRTFGKTVHHRHLPYPENTYYRIIDRLAKA